MAPYDRPSEKGKKGRPTAADVYRNTQTKEKQWTVRDTSELKKSK